MANDARYALWLKPYGDFAFKLQQRINELSKKHDTPTFEPHLTLLGGLAGSESGLTRMTDMLAHSLAPITVQLTQTDFGRDYYHCVFIKAKRSEELMHAHKTAAKLFEVEGKSSYRPHVSLMYGDLDVNSKERILNRMSRDIDTSFTAKNLLLVKTEGPPDRWEKIHSVEFIK